MWKLMYMQPLTAKRVKGGGFEVTERCTRCKTMVHQEIDSAGFVSKGTYDYSEAPDYLMPRGMGRIDRTGQAALRLERMKRRVGALPAVTANDARRYRKERTKGD